MIRIGKLLLLVPAAALAASILPTASRAQVTSTQTVIATGLNGPRGLKFGPDGMLYVAEAGIGGTTSTKGQCPQVVPPIGPYLGGNTGRISRIDKAGNRTTVAAGFPSSVNAVGDRSSIADLAWVDGNLYALVTGGGCSHGVPNSPNGIALVNTHNGSWKLIANLSKFSDALGRNSDRVDGIVAGLERLTGGGGKGPGTVYDLNAPRTFPDFARQVRFGHRPRSRLRSPLSVTT